MNRVKMIRGNSAALLVLIASLLPAALAAVEKPAVEQRTGQVSYAIDPSQRNPYSRIRAQLLPDSDFELAIMQTSQSGYIYGGVVVLKRGKGYLCEERALDVSSAINADGLIDPAKISGLKVKTRARAIDPELVTLLADELGIQVAEATNRPPHPPFIPLDGCQFEVYCEASAALIYPAAQDMINGPDLLSNALRQFVVSDNPSDLGVWYRLRDFLRAKKAGLKPSPLVPRKPTPPDPTNVGSESQLPPI